MLSLPHSTFPHIRPPPIISLELHYHNYNNILKNILQIYGNINPLYRWNITMFIYNRICTYTIDHATSILKIKLIKFSWTLSRMINLCCTAAMVGYIKLINLIFWYLIYCFTSRSTTKYILFSHLNILICFQSIPEYSLIYNRW